MYYIMQDTDTSNNFILLNFEKDTYSKWGNLTTTLASYNHGIISLDEDNTSTLEEWLAACTPHNYHTVNATLFDGPFESLQDIRDTYPELLI